MRSLISLVALLVLTGGFASAAPQPLSVAIDGTGAHTQSLKRYVSGEPIAVRVTAQTAGIDGVSVVATGPDGSPVRTPLGRDSAGAFAGDMSLETVGTWSVALETRTGSLTATTTPVTLEVTEPAGTSPWLLGLGLGAALFALAGAGGFVLLRRSAEEPETPPSRAAA